MLRNREYLKRKLVSNMQYVCVYVSLVLSRDQLSLGEHIQLWVECNTVEQENRDSMKFSSSLMARSQRSWRLCIIDAQRLQHVHSKKHSKIGGACASISISHGRQGFYQISHIACFAVEGRTTVLVSRSVGQTNSPEMEPVGDYHHRLPRTAFGWWVDVTSLYCT